ncbi:pre-mrna-splicing factor syf1-like [Stylonychia lemnae]|uniref:Pre-mrna-splicing factor syf1-like n=1 Tax=Stylonychia lemnae TaxID=5949 RepID=A0A078AZX5_STYLE|nr:pre-mrna-splicing factor syf1-like [Stylonychia lemnae]|eukprot:CDW87965.1 pre-mrna-splicing factor syf1-like [Stylonychia lemnae]
MEKFFKAPDEFSTEDYLGTIANPYHFRSWWNSIQALSKDNYSQRAQFYQRALQYLPGSYKLWYSFIKESRRFVKQQQFSVINDPEHYDIVNEIFERALVYMTKMPKIWLDFAKFMSKQLRVTDTRKIYDRALVALPVTQHQLIWDQYIIWASSLEDYTETACNIYRRYIDFKPEDTEYYVDYLLKNENLEEALDLYLKILEDDGFVSAKGKTRYQLWMELCEFIAKNPQRCNFQQPEAIIRHGIRKYTDEVGKLWIYLAEYYIRLGLFGRARDVFEEALATITTARDFGIIFNSYMKFEEQMVEEEDQDEDEDDDENDVEDQIDMLINLAFKDVPERQHDLESDQETDKVKLTHEDKMNAKFFRLENLIQRRPFLMSNTVLRQNPHNVYEWLNRIQLCQDDPYLAIKTYTEAITTVDPAQAFGKPSKIWISFAHFYEQNDDDLENANLILHKASQLNYKSYDELANIYCCWAEMQLRHKNYESALLVMQQACTANRPHKGRKEEKDDGHQKTNSLYNNLKCWSFYVDLLESISTVENTKSAYERMMQLKIATPQTILNYARFLQQNNYFEESYRVYERAIGLFDWPHLYEIWGCYLSSIIERYSDAKVERIRDLFEQVLKTAPSKQAKLFYYMYADFEEHFGLINHAMKIYDRACKDLDKEEKFEVYNMQIAKAAEFYGIQKTRQLFERAFELLQGEELIQVGLRFAKMERKLGEINRARAIYQHLSQYCNPRIKINEDQFWNIWEKFEVYHGNEDTYSDYMRAKRTVELRYSVINPIASLNMESSKLAQIEMENDLKEIS